MDPNQIPQMPQAPMPPMPPTPTDPGMPAPQPGVPTGGDEPITAEEKQTLLSLIAKIKSELGNLQAVSGASNGKADLLRRELLKQVFEKLQMAGVDLSSRESVSAFIMRLQEQNPELADMFEKSMNVLMGGQAMTSPDPNAPPPPDTGAPLDPGAMPPQDPNALPAQPPQIG